MDDSPPGSARFDLQVRVAWLLTTTRLLSGDPALVSRSQFIRRLGALGVPADASRVSRWESGQLGVPLAGITGYAAAAGLDLHRTVALMRLMARSGGAGRTTPDGDYYADLGQGGQVVESLLHRAADPNGQPLDGSEWLRLALDLTRYELVFLRQTTWRRMCSRLVSELARSTGAAQVQRHEAAATLLTSPAGRAAMLHASGEWLTAPGVQSPGPVMMLLSETDDAAACTVALRFLGDGSRALREAALPVIAAMARRRQVPPDALPRLEAVCLRLLRAPVGHRAHRAALDLAASLPEASVGRIASSVDDHALTAQVLSARVNGLQVAPDHAQRIGRAMAARIRDDDETVGLARDVMLERLLQESLFHVHAGRRRLAAQLLGASPYAAAVRAGLQSVLCSDDRVLALGAASALAAFDRGETVDPLLDTALALTRPAALHEALLAASMVDERWDEEHGEDLVELAAGHPDESVRAAAVPGLGMARRTGDRVRSRLAPAEAAALDWWRGHGGAVSDRAEVSAHARADADPRGAAISRSAG